MFIYRHLRHISLTFHLSYPLPLLEGQVWSAGGTPSSPSSTHQQHVISSKPTSGQRFKCQSRKGLVFPQCILLVLLAGAEITLHFLLSPFTEPTHLIYNFPSLKNNCHLLCASTRFIWVKFVKVTRGSRDLSFVLKDRMRTFATTIYM